MEGNMEITTADTTVEAKTGNGKSGMAVLAGTALMAVGVGIGFIVGKKRGKGVPQDVVDTITARVEELEGVVKKFEEAQATA